MGLRDLFSRDKPTSSTRGRFGVIPGAAPATTGSIYRPGLPQRGPAQPWQIKDWEHYNAVGEAHYAATFLGACFSRCRLYAGIVNEDEQVEPIFDEDGMPRLDVIDPQTAVDARNVIGMLRAERGGQAPLLRLVGINMGVTADMWLLGTDRLDAGGRVTSRFFEVCSIREIVTTGDGWARKRSPSSPTEPLDPVTQRLVRIYAQHPEFSELADSPNRAMGDVLDRMRVLTLAGIAEANSRVAGAGIWLVPEEIDWDDDTDDDTPPMQRKMIDVMSQAIKDPGSASAFVPYVAEVPGAMIQQMKEGYVRFDRPDYDIDKRREAALKQYGGGIDLPVEILTGADQNHWNRWSITEETWKAHVEPKVDTVTAALTARYLIPQMLLLDNRDPAAAPDPGSILERLVVAVDASRLVVHPNREAAADVGYGTAAAPTLLVSGAAWRRLHGIDEGDAPDDAEIEERIAVAERLKTRTTGTPADQLPLDTGTAGDTVSGAPPAGADGGVPGAVAAAVMPVEVAAAVMVSAERAADRIAAKAKDRARKLPGLHVNGAAARTVVAQLVSDPAIPFVLEPADLPPGEFAALERVMLAAHGPAVAAHAVRDAELLAWELAAQPVP